MREAMTPRTSRIKASIRESLSLNTAKISSSRTYGTQRAAAKGQPRIPATANHVMPCQVFSPPRQFMKDAAPSIPAYMAKLEGKKAALAWKFPGLMMVITRKKRPILALSAMLTAWNMMV